MTTRLSPNLSTHLSALQTPPSDAAIEAAQRKLVARLSKAHPVANVRRPWLGWVAAVTTGCLVLALVMLPATPGIAFATVQKHLRDFTTLSMTIEQQSQGIEMPGIHVRMNRDGDVRTDLGEATSIVVSPREHRMLTLLHGPHMAMQTPLDARVSARPNDNLAWLDAIRRFQGQARQLRDKRVIDGRPTTGWALDTEGMHIVLWADSDDLPRAVVINGGKLMSQRMHVAVDEPIDGSVFSTRVPDGYRLMPTGRK